MNRREFLCASAGAACVLAALPAAATESAPGQRVALVGCGPRGLALARTATQAGGCRISGTWDATPALAHAAAAAFGAAPHTSLRELLASDAPEIAIVAGRVTAPGITELLRAGVHLFLDTVPTVSRAESAALRETAASSGTVAQVNRDGSAPAHSPEATALLRSGQIGEVSTARAHVHYYHPSGLRARPGNAIGWASELFAMNGAESLRRVTATGSERDQVITWEFDRLTAIWEQRSFEGAAEERVCASATWYGAAGVLHVAGDTWRVVRHGDLSELRGTIRSRDWDAASWSELIRALREQRPSHRSLQTALKAAEMVRLAECSEKLERPLEWDNRRGMVVRDPEANRLLRAAPEWPA